MTEQDPNTEKSQFQMVLRPATPTMSFGDVEKMATTIAKSGLFPDINTPDKAAALMLLCQSEGLHPVAAMRRFHIVKGRPSMRADAMLAEFQRAGGTVAWIKSDDQEARCVFRHPAGGEVEFAFTLAEAQRAGLTANDNWRKYAAAMLRARCISGGIRMILPGVVVGIYTPEEVEDFDTPRPAQLEEPAPKAFAMPQRKSEQPKEVKPLIEPSEIMPDPEPILSGVPEERPAQDAGAMPRYVKDVVKREGQTRGKPWTLYTVHFSDDTRASTFDEALADVANSYRQSQEPIAYTYEAQARGRKLTGIVALSTGEVEDDETPF